jgi:hypothetical protein
MFAAAAKRDEVTVTEFTFRVVTFAVLAPREVTNSELTLKVVIFAVAVKRDVTLTVFMFDVPWARTLNEFM